MGTVLPTSVTDLCAEAVHRSGNIELSLLNSQPNGVPVGVPPNPSQAQTRLFYHNKGLVLLVLLVEAGSLNKTGIMGL